MKMTNFTLCEDRMSVSIENTSAAMALSPPEGCIVLPSTGQAPWSNPEDLVTIDVQVLLSNIKSMIILPILFIVGTPTNLLSMVVFYKHGLQQRTNVCLFTLSLIDLLFGIVSFCVYVDQLESNSLTEIPYFGHVAQFLMNNHVLGFYGLGWASLFVSAIISVERCLCIVFPLRFQTLVKTRTTWGVLSVGVFIITAGSFGVTEKYSVICMFDEQAGVTRKIVFASEYYLQYRQFVDTLDIIVFGLILPIAAVATVTIATSVTAINLKKTVDWRQRSFSASSLPVSAKEIALTKMLIYLSIQFIILNIPSILFKVVCVFVQEISNYGRYYNLYFVLLGIVEITISMNSSLNFFVYFFKGTKYRNTVLRFFRLSHKKKAVSEKETVIGKPAF